MLSQLTSRLLRTLPTCSISPSISCSLKCSTLFFFIWIWISNLLLQLQLRVNFAVPRKKNRGLAQVTPLVHTVKAKLDLNKVKQANSFFSRHWEQLSWTQDVKPQFHILFLSSSKSLSHNTRVFNRFDADTLSEHSIHTSCSYRKCSFSLKHPSHFLPQTALGSHHPLTNESAHCNSRTTAGTDLTPPGNTSPRPSGAVPSLLFSFSQQAGPKGILSEATGSWLTPCLVTRLPIHNRSHEPRTYAPVLILPLNHTPLWNI